MFCIRRKALIDRDMVCKVVAEGPSTPTVAVMKKALKDAGFELPAKPSRIFLMRMYKKHIFVKSKIPRRTRQTVYDEVHGTKTAGADSGDYRDPEERLVPLHTSTRPIVGLPARGPTQSSTRVLRGVSIHPLPIL